MGVNTTESILSSKVTEASLQGELDRAKIAFKNEKVVTRKLNPNLKKMVGNDLPIVINGVVLVLPVNGTEFEIPETFAKHLDDYLANLKY